MTLTNTVANAVLAAMHPLTGYATLGSINITYPIKIRLMGTNGSGSAAGTEIASGGSYTAVTGISTGANWASPSSAAQSTNAVISQTNMPTVTTNGVEFWDSSGTPIRVEFQSITPKATVLGDTLSFTSGAITSAFA